MSLRQGCREGVSSLGRVGRGRAGRAQLQVATEADSRGGEESAMTLAPGWFRTAPLFLGSGRAGIEVVISTWGRSAAPGLCHRPHFTGKETEVSGSELGG